MGTVVRSTCVMSGRLAAVLVAALGLACRGEARGQPQPPSRPAPPATVAAPATGPADTIGRADATGRIVAVGIASRVGTSGAADATPKRARQGEPVTLFAVLVADDGTIYSDAGALRWRGKAVTPRPLADAPAATLAWAKIEPTLANMSNTASGGFRYEPIPYAATPLAATGGAVTADVHPTLTPDHGHGLGTMRYQLVVRQGDRTIASPGVEARRARAAGGLTDDVARISVRKDDSFLGYLTEMFGQPYIWASAGPSDKGHQSEHLEGSDCADLMVYGARRAGWKIPYGWTGSLKQHARVVSTGALADDGIYRDRAGAPVPFPRPGDLILFPRHVGALTEDRGTPGVLDVDDLMIHTLFDSPKEQALRDSGYADNPIEILRWKAR